MLDIRRLYMLKTVAARGSITAAAQSLALSAGAVSQQLSALRHDVGVDLLRPDGRSVALTEAGQVLLEHADRILAAVEEAESAIAVVKGTVGATTTLAALPSTVARIVAPALTALGSHHPQLTVTCLVTDQAQLRELTLGTVDVVLGQRYHHLPDATPGASRSHRCSTIRCSSSRRPTRPTSGPSTCGNWPHTRSPCRRRPRTAGRPSCRLATKPASHRRCATSPPTSPPSSPSHGPASPPRSSPNGHRPDHTGNPHGAHRGPPDPAPPVRRDPPHPDREPDDHGRHRSAAHSGAAGSHQSHHARPLA